MSQLSIFHATQSVSAAVISMRGSKTLTLASRALAQPTPLARSASRVCIFCQLQAQQPIRNISQSSRRPAQLQQNTSSPAGGQDVLPSQGVSSAPSTTLQTEEPLEDRPEAEFEYDIDPEEDAEETKPQKQGTRSPARRFVLAQAKKRNKANRKRRAERQAVLEASYEEQNRLTEVLKEVKAGTGAYQKRENTRNVKIAGGEVDRPMETIDAESLRAEQEMLEKEALEDRRRGFKAFGMGYKITPLGASVSTAPGSQLQATAALYRAIVETYAAISAKRPAAPSNSYRPKSLFNATQHVKMEVALEGDQDGKGTIRLVYPSKDVEEEVLGDQVVEKEAFEEPHDIIKQDFLDRQDQIVKSWGREWLHIPLDNPQIKFAILKRFSYLTSRRVPDSVIHRSKTAFIFLAESALKESATKVHASLVNAKESPSKTHGTLRTRPGVHDGLMARKADVPLLQLPNVKVRGSKVSIEEKENAIGRQKVIDRELDRRGLTRKVLEAKGIYLRSFGGHSARRTVRA